MDEQKLPVARVTPNRTASRLTSRTLAKELFAADVPDQAVRSIPAQSLYMAIKQNGLESSLDVLEVATIDQCRTMLDLDCWERDHFNEEQFWEWLGITDAEHSLAPLQKLLKSIDLKLIALLISKYVEVRTFEEPTDVPPGPNFYTPDQGHTWLYFKIEEGTRHFLLARMIALIFETSGELFYQLLSIPSTTTDSMLEEEAFQDKSKRLLAEGIPDDALAVEVCAPLNESQLRTLLQKGRERPAVEPVPIIEPLLYDRGALKPFSEIMHDVRDADEFEAELTFIMNAALVHWQIEYFEHETVVNFTAKVKGAINIGLEHAMRLTRTGARETYETLGLQNLFRLGLSKLFSLRSLARKVPFDSAKTFVDDNITFAALAGAREAFPEMPEFINDDGSVVAEHEHLKGKYKAIETSQELECLLALLQKKVEQISLPR